MTNGFDNASSMSLGFENKLIVHSEINNIETQIMNISNDGYREIIINNTVCTDKNINQFVSVDGIDINDNYIELTDHGFVDGDYVSLNSDENMPAPLERNVFYPVEIIDVNTFRLLKSDTDDTIIDIETVGTGNVTVKKVIDSEKYYKAWRYFYLIPNARKYLTVLSVVEEHFRYLGYSIKRYHDPSTDTISWKISW